MIKSLLNRIINGKTSLTPESWLEMQDKYSLWIAKKELDLGDVEKLIISA